MAIDKIPEDGRVKVNYSKSLCSHVAVDIKIYISFVTAKYRAVYVGKWHAYGRHLH
jgi:hypothetical protein